MKIEDVIYQLESLVEDRKSFFDDGEDEIFRADVEALEKAIEIIRGNSSDEEKVNVTDKNKYQYKHDKNKPRLDLVPPGIIEAVGYVRTYGVKKYGANTHWQQIEPERYRAALMRHLCEYLRDPRSVDEESGLPHLWHAACNIAFLCELERGGKDGPKKST